MEPTLEQVIEVIRESSGHRRNPIDEDTLIEADLGICGDDGQELLEDCERAFNIEFHTANNSLRNRFALAENEYLFTSEGFDPFGVGRFIRWIRGIPEPIIRDLTVGKLHNVLVEAVREQCKKE